MTDLLGWPAFLCATASLLERAGRCAAGPMSPRCANVTTNSDVGKMRHEKAEILLKLARSLAASAEGMTLDEMAREAGVGRRTAERMRDALWALFPQMEEMADPPTKRFRIPQGLDGLFQNPSAEEPALIRALRQAIMALKAVRFRYRGGSRRGAARDVIPYGIMFGRANYLVASEVGPDGSTGEEPRNYRLDRIEELEVLETPGAAPE